MAFLTQNISLTKGTENICRLNTDVIKSELSDLFIRLRNLVNLCVDNATLKSHLGEDVTSRGNRRIRCAY